MHTHCTRPGQEDPEALLGQIALKLSSEFQLTMAQTKPHVSAELLAQQALAEGVDLVVASGGDGTVGAVAGGRRKGNRVRKVLRMGGCLQGMVTKSNGSSTIVCMVPR
jgi:diacylglycerol kinase family enzyme